MAAFREKKTRIAIVPLVLLLQYSIGMNVSSAATAKEIDASVKACMDRFYKEVDGATEYIKASKGLLVFPKVVKAGFLIGGEYGEGALLVDGATVDYYNIASGSFGLQAGAQKKDIILLFMKKDALKDFQSSSGWKIGVDGNITLIDIGKGATADTINMKDPIIGFVFGQKGLMADISLAGSKISKMDKSNE